MPTSVAFAETWALGPTVVLLKRATHRPRPGALRPISMLPAGPAVFFRVGLPVGAARPWPDATSPRRVEQPSRARIEFGGVG